MRSNREPHHPRPTRARAAGRQPRRAPRRLALVLVIAAATGCGGGTEGGGFAFDNNLFQSTARLEAAATGAPNAPHFSWPSTGRSLVVLGVFRRRIDVRHNLITNTGDLVWLWHSGLPTGREGNLTWSDGRPVLGGLPQEDLVPAPLSAGTYYWAVWAFDDRGEPVASSTELTLDVP